MKKYFDYIVEFIKLVHEDNISLYAAQSSFFIIISSIPFILLLLAAARLIIPFESYTLIAVAEQYVPYNLIGMIEYVINEVYDKASSVSIVSLSAITLVWSASKGLASLGKCVCGIYEQDAFGYVKSRLVSMMYTFLFAVMIIAVLTFVVFARVFEVIRRITEGPAVTFFALALFFSMLYYVSSKKKMRYVRNLIGSAFAAVGWFVFSYFFGIYIDRVADYSYMYGSFGVMVGFMLWLYFCIGIVLLGAEVNVYISKKHDGKHGI